MRSTVRIFAANSEFTLITLPKIREKLATLSLSVSVSVSVSADILVINPDGSYQVNKYKLNPAEHMPSEENNYGLTVNTIEISDSCFRSFSDLLPDFAKVLSATELPAEETFDPKHFLKMLNAYWYSDIVRAIETLKSNNHLSNKTLGALLPSYYPEDLANALVLLKNIPLTDKQLEVLSNYRDNFRDLAYAFAYLCKNEFVMTNEQLYALSTHQRPTELAYAYVVFKKNNFEIDNALFMHPKPRELADALKSLKRQKITLSDVQRWRLFQHPNPFDVSAVLIILNKSGLSEKNFDDVLNHTAIVALHFLSVLLAGYRENQLTQELWDEINTEPDIQAVCEQVTEGVFHPDETASTPTPANRLLFRIFDPARIARFQDEKSRARQCHSEDRALAGVRAVFEQAK